MKMVARKQKNAFANTLDADIMKQNKSHVSDFYYAVKISICLLKPIGAWPLRQQATTQEIIVHGLSIAIATFLQFFAIVTWIICIITTKWSFYEILRTACPLIFTCTVFLRYLLLLSHRDEIKSCIDRIAEDWRNVTIAEDREIMLANAKSGRFFGIISVAFMFGSGIPYTCMPLVLPPIVTEDNVTIRTLPNPCELFFLDVQVSPVYEISYALEALSCFTAYIVFCGICSLTAKFVTHVCGQCEILMYIFEELIDGGDRNRGTVDQRISTAIIHHLRILKFVSDVDKVLNEICLAEFINASCNICLLGYYVIMNKARNLMFPILMSSYPVELTAGKMVKLTMNSFSNIIKEKWSVFLILREMCGILFTTSIFARYILLLWHQDRLKSCIDRVVDDWRCAIIVEDRDIMLMNAKVGRTFGIVSVTFMFSCGALFYTLPMVLPNAINEDNVTVRLHPSPCEFFVFDSKASPAYEIVYFLQLLSGYTAYSAFCGICSLMAHFVTHVCGQCDMLAAIFEETVDGGKHNDGSIENRIATAVTRHLRLLRT
ncbi:odorant receptor 13a [Lasius niger]|uniref:Odorant receptor 13a n=1 Tax=Lasius niger TaxID=67767 RepID=A0A0J7P2C3_LASNI|nr:odorant receptor 13a [Lasius niger]